MAFVLLRAAVLVAADGPALPAFDFTKPEQVKQWRPLHDIGRFEPTAEGLLIQITSIDPYFVGPPRDYPAGVPMKMHIRLKSDQGGSGQLFFFERVTTEEQSVHFPVKSGQWVEAVARVPALGPKYQMRIDPPGSGGQCVIAAMWFEPTVPLLAPAWPRPVAPSPAAGAPSVHSGELELVHDGTALSSFDLRLAGKSIAAGLNRTLIGWQQDRQLVWIKLDDSVRPRVEATAGELTESVSLRDAGGATWSIVRRYLAHAEGGRIDVQTTVRVDRPRDAVFLPMFALLPGAGSFGTHKAQGLFAGVEYLDDEPSSSEADIVGPESHRQVPSSHKLTFPLMAVVHGGRYVALSWEMRDELAALYDSPDRLFNSGGHVMGVMYPGCDGNNRVEGSLLPELPQRITANKPLILNASIIAGPGRDATDAVRRYVKINGLPPMPEPRPDFRGYCGLMAAGWLDSQLGEDGRYSHAIPGHFKPQPAADAAMWQDWLAAALPGAADAALRDRLSAAAKAAIAQVSPGAYGMSQVGHVHTPVGALVYGHVGGTVAGYESRAKGLIRQFEPDGSYLYKPRKDGADYGKTHFAKDANGLAALSVKMILEAAMLGGDPELASQGLRLLRAMDKFDGSVPRGAQTWECPLHSPDILASANLVNAYVLGYELSGDQHLLEQARYWAWTGVPFVYLRDVSQPVGRYAGIGVFCATNWQAPVWIGMPVQWCAAVYADALYCLSKHDPEGPWRTLADGIAFSGVQQTFPVDAGETRQGLLPDSFVLAAQSRNNPGINPGTLMAIAGRAYGKPPVYDRHCFRTAGVIAHAPGWLSNCRESAGLVEFTFESWTDQPHYIVLAGLKPEAQVTINGQPATPAEPRDQCRWAVYRVKGKSAVSVAQ